MTGLRNGGYLKLLWCSVAALLAGHAVVQGWLTGVLFRNGDIGTGVLGIFVTVVYLVGSRIAVAKYRELEGKGQ